MRIYANAANKNIFVAKRKNIVKNFAKFAHIFFNTIKLFKMNRTINNYNFKGKQALVRVDFNVPLNENFSVSDDTRIRASIPTIKKILSDGGSAILMSHLGRPKGGFENKYSLKHIVNCLSENLGKEVKFADDCIGESAKTLANSLKEGEILLLENLRFYKEEEKGDEEFAKKLSELGNVYVNDAFGTAHRAHASTTIVAKFFPNDKLFGYLMANEIESINKVLNEAKKPLTAIIGGAKVSTKIPIIEFLLDKVDNLIIGGGMAYTFAKAQGGKVGKSLVEDEFLKAALLIIQKANEKKMKIFLPTDTVISDAFSNEANRDVCDISAIPDGWMGMDIGPETQKNYEQIISNSKTILWNGPMGVFEMSNFETGTQKIAEAVAAATQKAAFSLIGGGDSVAAINKYHLAGKVSYVSTGGGAMLECLEGKILPGVKAILE